MDKPTIHQRIKEVKDKIDIDLTQPGRQRVNFYLRTMITSEYPELTLHAIADAFGVDHSTVVYYRQNFQINCKQPEYKVIVECLRLGIKPDFVRKKKQYRKREKPHETVQDRVIQKIPQFEVNKVLAKDRKNELWLKEIHLWSEKDWENFYKLRSA